jgi:hypothetical protein
MLRLVAAIAAAAIAAAAMKVMIFVDTKAQEYSSGLPYQRSIWQLRSLPHGRPLRCAQTRAD